MASAEAEATPAAASPVVVETGSSVATAAAGVMTNLLTGLIIVAIIVAAAYVLLPSFGELFCKIPLVGSAMCPGGCRTAAHPRGDKDPTGICFECPVMMTRTAAPVTDSHACAGYGLGEPNDSQGLTYCQYMHGSRSFPDDTEHGTCWTCPDGMDRALIPPVTAKNACVRPGGEASCSKFGEGVFGDLDGSCWRCRPGWIRTTEKATSDKACSAGLTAIGPEAIAYCKKIGGHTAYPDPNYDCYACPAGMQQSGADSHSRTACTVAPVWEGGAASHKAQEWCKHHFDADRTDADGYCYKCPRGYKPTVLSAKGPTACVKGGIFGKYHSARRVGAWTSHAKKIGRWAGPADKVAEWTAAATKNGKMSAPATTYTSAT